MAVFRNYVRPGMRVVASDGQDVGIVARVSPDGFVTTNPPEGRVTVPYDSIQNVLGDEILLNVPASEVSARTA